jgi:glucose/arabinose dehydrogenase
MRRVVRMALILLTAFSMMHGVPVKAAGKTAGDIVVGEVPQKVEDVYVYKPGDFRTETWIKGLQVPWSLVFLPDGRALVSERPGRIRLIRNDRLVERPYMELEVNAAGEGGLMGLAVHPRFEKEAFIYAMHTYRDKGEIYNRVIRLRDQGESATMDRVIIDRIPGARNHNGGRIAFGPDGLLYVCTGETWTAPIAQELDNLGGKILRLDPDGGIPADNPFAGSPVYSYGHRNPQGIAWHPRTGDLFSSEHGPSGESGLRGRDIINVIQKGGNFGWPIVVGKVGQEPYHDPLIMWEEATPPAGMTFFNDDLYVATLRTRALVRIRLSHAGGAYEVTAIERLFARKGNRGEYGRLRDAVAGPDGNLYVLTSNRDGRGKPHRDDDRILRLIPRK